MYRQLFLLPNGAFFAAAPFPFFALEYIEGIEAGRAGHASARTFDLILDLAVEEPADAPENEENGKAGNLGDAVCGARTEAELQAEAKARAKTRAKAERDARVTFSMVERQEQQHVAMFARWVSESRRKAEKMARAEAEGKAKGHSDLLTGKGKRSGEGAQDSAGECGATVVSDDDETADEGIEGASEDSDDEEDSDFDIEDAKKEMEEEDDDEDDEIEEDSGEEEDDDDKTEITKKRGVAPPKYKQTQLHLAQTKRNDGIAKPGSSSKGMSKAAEIPHSGDETDSEDECSVYDPTVKKKRKLITQLG